MNERKDRIVSKLFRFSVKDGKRDYPLNNIGMLLEYCT